MESNGLLGMLAKLVSTFTFVRYKTGHLTTQVLLLSTNPTLQGLKSGPKVWRVLFLQLLTTFVCNILATWGPFLAEPCTTNLLVVGPLADFVKFE